MLKCPPFSRTAHPGLHLVANHQRSVSPTERLRFLEEIVRGIVYPLPLHRLEQKRCDILFLEKPFQRLQVAQANTCDVGQKRPESFLKITAASRRKCTVSETVIA